VGSGCFVTDCDGAGSGLLPTVGGVVVPPLLPPDPGCDPLVLAGCVGFSDGEGGSLVHVLLGAGAGDCETCVLLTQLHEGVGVGVVGWQPPVQPGGDVG
jgi:hypothetical protein